MRSTGRGQSTPRPNRRSQNIVIGKKVSAGLRSWRGADLTTDLYLGYFSVGTSVDEVKFNFEDQGVNVVELEQLHTQHNKFKSFKMCIRKNDMEKVKRDDFEIPEGVVIRYFYQKKNNDGAPILYSNENGSQ